MSCPVPLGRIIPKDGAFRMFPIDLWTIFGWAIFTPLKLLRCCSLVSFRSALLPWPVTRFGMELNNLSPKKVTELENELTTLSKRHLDALQSAIYVGMNEEEAEESDQSRVRISELYELLKQFVDNDIRNWS